MFPPADKEEVVFRFFVGRGMGREGGTEKPPAEHPLLMLYRYDRKGGGYLPEKRV